MNIDESTPISQLGKNIVSKSTANNGGIAQDSNLDKDIEENVFIHAMSKKLKRGSSSISNEKTRAIGAIIMIIGFFVLAGLVYLAYIYLINPTIKKDNSQVNQGAVKNESVKKEEKKEESKKVEEVKKEEKTPVKIEENEVIKIEEETATSGKEIISEDATTSNETEIENSSFSDLDKDGLSDAEENIIGSNKNLADSDGDGYADQAEVNNFYDPAGSGKLSSNPNFSKYQNVFYNYNTIYPLSWLKQAGGDGSSVIFGATDGSFIQIISQANVNGENIESWFNNQFPETSENQKEIIVKNGWEGIFHSNKNIFYLTDSAKKYIFVISYVPEPENNLNYYNIFKIIINSFETAK